MTFAPYVFTDAQYLVAGSTSDWSDDEPAKKDASHPQLTKFVKIILGRCDDEETARSHNETSNGHVDNVC